MAQKPYRNRIPRSEALTQLALEPATIKHVDTLVAFEQKVADPKIYGPTLDAPGAVQEITSNQLVVGRRQILPRRLEHRRRHRPPSSGHGGSPIRTLS